MLSPMRMFQYKERELKRGIPHVQIFRMYFFQAIKIWNKKSSAFTLALSRTPQTVYLGPGFSKIQTNELYYRIGVVVSPLRAHLNEPFPCRTC